MFEIIRYTPEYENELMELIRAEGDDWEIYWGEKNSVRYRKAIEQSITYLALADALFIYVCDLLVNVKYRGNGLGERLMRCLQADYPDLPVYIMSGNDKYYAKTNCVKEGSIYLLK